VRFEMTSTYAVTLERGSDGSYLAWVDDLPGCTLRAGSREVVLQRLPGTILAFLAWAGVDEPNLPSITVTEEVESAVETEEDTELLVSSDRDPLTDDAWHRMQGWLGRSRAELLALLKRLSDEELDRPRAGSERTVGGEIEHVALVELMYAFWTFDRRSREGLAELLDWTRGCAAARLDRLASEQADVLTWADWGGAPRPEPWTPRKAVRRLVWHELLHLRAIENSPTDR